MFFIFEKEGCRDLNIDQRVLKEELDQTRSINDYSFFTQDEFSSETKFPHYFNQSIPIGGISFVQTFLSRFFKIGRMSAIEVPLPLRLDKFLNRTYAIVDKNDLPQKGCWFVKYASKLKEFSFQGNIEYLIKLSTENYCLKNGLYVLSEIKEIFSEYRVFVINNEIKGIQYYNGDPTIMPSPNEILKIQEMVIRYQADAAYPKAYSLDVAIIRTNLQKGRDVMVIECHPFVSLGLYGFSGSFLPLAYKSGFDWYVQHNTPLKVQKCVHRDNPLFSNNFDISS